MTRPDEQQAAAAVPPPADGRRLRFVDGLRGVAALYVVCFHLSFRDTSALYPVLHRMPAAAWAVVSHGGLGVEVFFVLSGFVIARSLRRDVMTGSFLARFAARRSLRLDLPYWTVLAVAVTLKFVLHRTHPDERWFAGTAFSATDVLANFTYVHTLLQRPVVLGVSWTLCLELMFYLSYAVLLGVAQRLGRLMTRRGGPPASPGTPALLAVFGPAFLASVFCAHVLAFGRTGDAHSGAHAYVAFSHLFLLGAVLQWTVGGWLHAGWFAAAVAAVAGLTLFDSLRGRAVEWNGVVGVATVVLMYAADRFDRWDRWLAGPVIQFFGRTSYSLYLVHLPVCTVVLSAVVRVLGRDTVRGAVVGIPVAFAVTVVATVLLNRLVELPSLRLSHRIPMRPTRPAADPSPAPAPSLAAVA